MVAISSFGQSQLYRWINHDQWAKVKIVHCGIEPNFYQNIKALPKFSKSLVCVGRLCEQKGQLLLIEAVRQILNKGIDFELVLAGDGEMRSEIESLITKYQLASNIRITGWISSDEVKKEILAAGALVLPSFAEGLPVVIMEALALKKPVLSTYVAGIPELVLDNECGWLFPAGSVESLVVAIERFLNTSPNRLAEMGELGYARVLESHQVDKEASKLIALFGHS